MHRLELEFPDLYKRLQRVTNGGRSYHERLMWPLATALRQKALESGKDVPPLLRQVWNVLGANHEPSPEVWEKFKVELNSYDLTKVGVNRAGFNCASPDEDHSDRRAYQAYWRMARTMEVFGGWAHRPLPLADMAYAATAARVGDIRLVLEPELHEIEQELLRP